MGDSVNGGNTYKVMDYAVNHGIVLESECPVQGTDNRARRIGPWPPAGRTASSRATSDYTTIAQGTNIDYVKNCLKTYGP